jgi:regulator of sigma E protease
MPAFLSFLIYYSIPFLLVLTLVVTIHEMGHFLVARAFGVAVDRFSIGFGRTLVSWRDKSGTEWRIALIPLGGYVRFAGDADASSAVPDAHDLDELRRRVVARQGSEAVKRYFAFKPVWQRALVVAAGPIANFILAICIFASLTFALGADVWAPRIGSVVAGSPAAKAGLLVGDEIVEIDGQPIQDFRDISQHVRLRSGEPIRLLVRRAGHVQAIEAVPVRRVWTDPLTGRAAELGFLGVGQSRDPADFRHVRYTPVEALGHGVQSTWDILATTVTYLERIFQGRESPNQLGSFIGMAQTSGAVAKAAAHSTPDFGLKLVNIALSLLGLSAVLSTGIGFMNLLPVPILDGGHLMFYAYEAVARRPVSASIQAIGQRLGLALLLGLMLFATWNDLQQQSVFQKLGGLFF